MNQRPLVHVEFHGISSGQTLYDIQSRQKTGITPYLRKTLPDVDFLVTAITDDKVAYIGGRMEMNFLGSPYVRIYHTCSDEAMLASILKIISEYPTMYRYGTQVVRMSYTPPDCGGHLP